jgi:hypothetical protein
MVNGLSYLNYIEFSLVLSLFSLLFRKFLIRKITSIIWNFIKNINNKKDKAKEVESINDEIVKIKPAINTLDKYTDFIIVLFICFLNYVYKYFFSNNLAENIDSYVTVYKHIKNNSFVCLFSINDNIVSKNKNYLCNQKNNKFIFPFSFLTEIKFINLLMLNLKFFSLKNSPIVIIFLIFTTIFFTRAVSPLLI